MTTGWTPPGTPVPFPRWAEWLAGGVALVLIPALFYAIALAVERVPLPWVWR